MARTDKQLTSAEVQVIQSLDPLGSPLQQIRVNAGGTSLEYFTAGGGSGDVVGPASATNNVPALFDGTTGKLIKNSTPTGTGNPVMDTSPTIVTPTIARVNGQELRATGAAGIELENSAGTATIITGAGGGTGTSIVGTTNIGSASADYFQIAGGTGTITETATGSSSSIDINIIPKGTGRGKVGGSNIMTEASTDSVTGIKTFTTGVSILAPQGFLINGRITPTVASNNLTLTLQTAGGATPSSTDPVFCRIGNTVRTVTSSLSVTLNAGTNWFSSGGAELATFEIDYFAYLGYNATDGVTLGFARVPYAKQYSQFSTTTTNERYLAVSNRTNASSNDNYEVVGRFAATLSATAAFNWSVPTYTPLNLINNPIYETRWLTFLPTISYNGTAPSGTETRRHRYKISGETCQLSIHSEWTTAGTGVSTVTATTPIEESVTFLNDGLTGGLNIGTGSGYGVGNSSTVQLRGRTTRTNGNSINSNTFVVAGIYQILGT